MLKRFAVLLALAVGALPALAADLPGHPFIHVNGAAELRMMPDTGEIDFEIVSLDPDPEAAWKLVSERLEATRALFAQHGVAADDVFVQDIVRRPRKLDRPAGDPAAGAPAAGAPAAGAPVPMETRAAMHVTVRDLGPWSAMLRSLLAVREIESLAVAFSRSDRDQIEADLVRQALAEAKAKAQNIARSIGARLGPVTGVALSPLKNLSNAMGMATEPSYRYTGGARGDAPDVTLIQSMRLAQGADVIYRIGGK